MALLCSYRELLSTGVWEVLARASRSRCASPRNLRTIDARSGQVIAIPRAPADDDVVFARIRIRQTLSERLATLLFKRLHQPAIQLDGKQYRLVASTATGPLILRMPRAAGMSALAGGHVDYRQLSLVNVASYRVQFYSMKLTKP